MKRLSLWVSVVLIACAATAFVVLSMNMKLRRPATVYDAFSSGLKNRKPPSMHLSPSSTTATVGETFAVSLVLEPGSKPVNTLGTRILYPSDLLYLVSKETSQSPFSIHLGYLAVTSSESVAIQAEPSPGISSGGTISIFTFRAIAPGQATVSMSPRSKLLLNDGIGTNVFVSSQGTTTINILPKKN